MRGIATILLLISLCLNNLLAQIAPEYRNAFVEAESYFLFEEYADALTYYRILNEVYPDNDNINYKIGVCMLNDPFNKEGAISYLEKAVQNTSLNCKDDSYKETKAPVEAYYYLGDAYRINNQLDKAIETYQKFKDIGNSETYDFDLVDDQIKACQHALQLMGTPVSIRIKNLGDTINTRFSDVSPVVSGDQNKLVYIQQQQLYAGVFYAEKKNGVWSFPRNIMFELALDRDVFPTGLSYDGTTLLLYRSDNYIGDIYISTYVNDQWTPPVKLNENINTKYWESHACFTSDGKTIYFTSNRKGTCGGLDIYYSRMDTAINDWGVPVNLGPRINTKYNEETPFITLDGKTLFFSSYGHYNMGGYDVFYSNLLEDSTWSAPINIGYPLNTTDDDIFYQPVQDMYHAFYPRLLDNGFGRQDIYMVEIFSDTHPRKFRINGIAGIQNLKILTKPVHVVLVEKYTRDTVAATLADQTTGRFTLEAVKGNYDLVFTGEEITPMTSNVVIPEGYSENDLNIDSEIPISQKESILLQFEPEVVDKIQTTDTLLMVDKGEQLTIELGLEKMALLVAETWHDSILIRTDTFRVDTTPFNLASFPVPGDNMIALKMIDAQGNVSYKDIHIIYTPPATDTGLVALADTEAIEYISDSPLSRKEAEKQVQSLVTDLSIVADGSLKDLLQNIDLAGEGISNTQQLITYLKANSARYGYSNQEVQDLIIKRIQTRYMEEYIDQLSGLTADENLKTAISGTNLFRNEITDLQGLYEHLVSSSNTGGYKTEQVNQVFSLLSQRVEVMSILDKLSTGSQAGLAEAVRDIDMEKANINNTVELFTFLFDKAGKYDYTEADVVNIMFDLLEEQDLRQMITFLHVNAPEKLADILKQLDPGQEHISNLTGLSQYLISRAKELGMDESEIYRLFLQTYDQIQVEKILEELQITQVPAGTRNYNYLYWSSGLAVLVIVLILIYRRRRKQPPKASS